MRGYWQLVFACCLLVQSLSAEDLVEDNSASAVEDNSASAVEDNSTSAVEDNSASAVEDNSASAVEDNSTSVVEDNSASAVGDNSASAVEDNSTSVVEDNSASAVEDNSASTVEDNSASTVEDNSTSELEKNVEQRIASLREMGQDEIRKFADIVLHHYNTQEASFFTPLKDANVTVKKAIGSMMYLRMTLEKTTCTKKDVNHHSHFEFFRLRDSEKQPPLKHCGPLADDNKEQLDCKFDIFKNERSYGEAVVSHDCKPIKVIDKGMLKF